MHPASARTADLPPKWRLSWLNGISCGDAGQTYSVAFLESTPGWAIFARAIRRRSEAGAQHACDEAFQPNGALYCPSNSLPGGDRVVRLLGHKPLCGQMLHRAFLLTISRMVLPSYGKRKHKQERQVADEVTHGRSSRLSESFVITRMPIFAESASCAFAVRRLSMEMCFFVALRRLKQRDFRERH